MKESSYILCIETSKIPLGMEFFSEQQGMSVEVIDRAYAATEEGFLSIVKKQWPIEHNGTGPCCPLGDAAGYVTKCSGEGIYFAAKNGRICAKVVVEGSENDTRMINEADLRTYLKKFDQTYWPTYKVLDIHQNVFYCSDPAREAFVEMCADDYVQNMTFDSYLYKRVVPGNPLDNLKLAEKIIGSLVRVNALRREMSKITL